MILLTKNTNQMAKIVLAVIVYCSWLAIQARCDKQSIAIEKSVPLINKAEGATIEEKIILLSDAMYYLSLIGDRDIIKPHLSMMSNQIDNLKQHPEEYNAAFRSFLLENMSGEAKWLVENWFRTIYLYMPNLNSQTQLNLFNLENEPRFDAFYANLISSATVDASQDPGDLIKALIDYDAGICKLLFHPLELKKDEIIANYNVHKLGYIIRMFGLEIDNGNEAAVLRQLSVACSAFAPVVQIVLLQNLIYSLLLPVNQVPSRSLIPFIFETPRNLIYDRLSYTSDSICGRILTLKKESETMNFDHRFPKEETQKMIVEECLWDLEMFHSDLSFQNKAGQYVRRTFEHWGQLITEFVIDKFERKLKSQADSVTSKTEKLKEFLDPKINNKLEELLQYLRYFKESDGIQAGQEAYNNGGGLCEVLNVANFDNYIHQLVQIIDTFESQFSFKTFSNTLEILSVHTLCQNLKKRSAPKRTQILAHL